jgi:hypothetical protein
MSIRENAEDIKREVVRLGVAVPVEVTDTRMRDEEEFTAGTLYLGQATSGIGIGADHDAAHRQSSAAIGMFFGRFGARTAMGSTVAELLQRLGLLPEE